LNLYKPKAMVSKYYMVLFTLPNWQILASILIVTGLIVIFSMGIYASLLVINSLLVFTILYIYSKLCKDTVFHKIKRIVGLALTILVYSSIYTGLTSKTLIGVVSSSTMLTVIILGLDGANLSRFFLAITPIYITLMLSHLLGFYTWYQVLMSLTIVLGLASIDLIIFLFMSRRRINHYSFPELGTMFLRNWLDRRTDIEKAFDELGEVQYVNPRIIELGDLLLIYTDVHYGPFSNIGSSRLPIILTHAFNKIGYRNVLTLHGLGSHDRNIASLDHASKYVEELVKTFLGNSGSILLYRGAFSVENSEWRLISIVFDKLTIIIASRPIKGIDDLPYDIQLEYELKTRVKGYGDVIILDAHNSELQDEPDLNSLKKLLDQAISKIEEYMNRPPVEVLYRYKCFESKAPGLVDGYGCIVCLSGENREEACILYLRGNNMKPGARENLIKAMEDIETPYLEVVTNDEHSETGTRAHIAYIPVHDTPDLIRSVKEACLELKRAPRLTGARVYSSRMNLKLMGDSVNVIKKELNSSLKEAAILLLTYVFITPLIISLLI